MIRATRAAVHFAYLRSEPSRARIGPTGPQGYRRDGRPVAIGLWWLTPLGFFDFVNLEMNALCVLSDSGTVQEECSILRVTVLDGGYVIPGLVDAQASPASR